MATSPPKRERHVPALSLLAVAVAGSVACRPRPPVSTYPPGDEAVPAWASEVWDSPYAPPIGASSADFDRVGSSQSGQVVRREPAEAGCIVWDREIFKATFADDVIDKTMTGFHNGNFDAIRSLIARTLQASGQPLHDRRWPCRLGMVGRAMAGRDVGQRRGRPGRHGGLPLGAASRPALDHALAPVPGAVSRQRSQPAVAYRILV